MPLSAILLVALLCVFNTAVARPDYDAPVYNVCTNSWEPISTCKGGVAGGLDVLEVNKIADNLGWTLLGKDEEPKLNDTKSTYFRYVCMSLEELEEDLSSSKGICHASTSLTVSRARMNKGMTFTFPLYRGNVAILTTARYTLGNGWGFTRPITTTVWVTILLTGFVLVPFLLVTFEYISEQERIPRTLRDFSTGMSNAVWNSMTTLLRVGGESIRSAEAKVVMIGYAFLVLIIITVYTANMTSNLTVRKIRATVDSASDLKGATVGTLAVYKHRLIRKGITNIRILKANATSMEDSLRYLEAGVTDALAMSSQWIAAVLQKRGCRDELFMFDLEVEPFDYALVFPSSVPSAVLTKTNRVIMELSEDAELQRLADDFGSKNECRQGRNESPLTVFGIWQVYGVWVLMGGCIFLAIMISVARCLLKRYKVYDVRMPKFASFGGDEQRDVEMVGPPPPSNGQGQRDGMEYSVLLEIQREMRDLSRKMELTHRPNRSAEGKPDDAQLPTSAPAEIAVMAEIPLSTTTD